MSHALPVDGGPSTNGPGDAELISAVRGGDVDAYGDLFARHLESARRLARQLVSSAAADDLVSEAFAKVLVVLQRGGGPDLAFRAYLLTAIRRLHVDRIRETSRVRSVDDLTPYDPGVPFHDTAVEGFENTTAARAFASLPERWQLVLWHTEVEGQKPADVAPLLGISANSVSALAYRAREGLRQAFVSMHAQEAENDDCAWTQQTLGAYIRNGTSRRDGAKVGGHVAECRRCMAIYLELTEVNANLSGILGPLVLGGAAAAYVAGATGGLATKGAVVFVVDRVKDLVLANAATTAVAGVAATAVVATGIVVGMQRAPQAPAQAGAPVRVAPAQAGSAAPDPSGQPTTPTQSSRGAGSGPPGDPSSTAGGPATIPTPVAPAGLGGSAAPTDPGVSPLDPSALPSAPPTGSVDPQPAFEPASEPSQEPTEPPTGPAQVDLSVSSSKANPAGLLWEVLLRVDGLPVARTATLTITTNNASVALTLDPRCGFLQFETARCMVDTSPTTYRFVAIPVPGSPTTLTFTVTPNGDAVDSAPEDNTTRVLLAP